MPHMTVDGIRIYKAYRPTGTELKARHPKSKVTRSFHRRSEESALKALQQWLRGPGEPSARKLKKMSSSAEIEKALAPQQTPGPLKPDPRDAFPAIKALGHRRFVAKRAVALLESVGMNDEAAMVEDSIKLTPVEAEAIKLWEGLVPEPYGKRD